MEFKPLTDEELTDTVNAYQETGSVTGAAGRLGLARSTVRHRLTRAAQYGMLGTSPVLPGFRIAQISTIGDGSGRKIRETIVQRPDHEGQFSVPEGHRIKEVSALVNSGGNVVQQWYKTREGDLTPECYAKAIREALAGFEMPPLPVIPSPDEYLSSVANVFVVADPHIGQLSWGDETGKGNYDIPIALRTFKDAFNRLADQSPRSEVGVVLGLGDSTHTDGYKPVTPQSGHALDADGRWPRILRAAIEMYAHAVAAALQRNDRVLVRIIPGNHDPQTAIAITIGLEERYRENPRVTVDSDPGMFWWWEWGECFLGAVHGDKNKMRDLPLKMASDNPAAWGRTRFRHIFTGHVHHESAVELGGVVVESFRAFTAADAYNAARYSSGRSLKAITLHKDEGEISRQTVNIV